MDKQQGKMPPPQNPMEAAETIVEAFRKAGEAIGCSVREAVAAQTVKAAFAAWRESPEAGLRYLSGLDAERLTGLAEFAGWVMPRCGRLLTDARYRAQVQEEARQAKQG